MNGRAPWQRCLGGSESAMVFAARALAARGHDVEVFTRCDAPGVYDGVTYHDMDQLRGAARNNAWDIFISLRFHEILQMDIRAALRVLWCQDVLDGCRVGEWLAWCDRLVFVSDWHRQRTVAAHPFIAPFSTVVRNPVDLAMVPDEGPGDGDGPLLVHLSRPERGLRPLLQAWPSIRARVPDARLAVARYRSYYEPRGSELEAFCLAMDHAVEASEGASHLGNLCKPQLYELLSRAALMVYPADFDETSCIAVIEAQACGVPVVATRRGALPETLAPEASVIVEPGDGMLERFTDEVVALLYEPERRRLMGLAGRERARQHDVAVIAERWEQVFLEALQAQACAHEPAILRTLASRGDRAAAEGSTPTSTGPAVARWPGWSEGLWQAVVQRLNGVRSILLVGDGSLASELARRTGAAVHAMLPLDPNAPRMAAALDTGALLAAGDRPAFLRWLSQRVDGVGPVVHVLPAASGANIHGQQVHPVYDDIKQWFGEQEGEPTVSDLALTLEAEHPWGEPARCWLVSYPAGAAPARPDRPARKRLLTRPVPTVSACMIVRDAASTLVTTLDSLLPIADEIRVLDTGSRDATLLLLDQYRRRCPVPIHVHQEPWPNDFGAARNMSIQGAESDWILWIDADEQLIGAEQLRRLLQSEAFEAFAIRQHNYIFDRGDTQVEHPFRVFRNGRGYRFYGAVHEHPERFLNQCIEPWMIAPDVEILHFGYLTEPTRRRKLLERNLRLLMLDFAKYPGRELTDILYLRDCVNLARFDAQAHRAIRPDHRVALLSALDRFERRYLSSRDRHYNLGREYYDRGLRLLGLGVDVPISVGAPNAPKQVYRCRHAQDATQLASEAAWRHFHRSRVPGGHRGV